MSVRNGNLTLAGFLDLVQNELRNARLQNLASDPLTPVEGQIYYNTVTKKKRTWNGTAWIEDVTTAGGDASTNTAASVDLELAVYSGTTGKLLKRAIGNGLVKATAGVVSYVTTLAVGDGGTGATTLTGVLKGNGTSAVTGGATISDLGAPTADVAHGGFKITGLADGTAASDAATKGQVDSVAQGIKYKDAVKGASTANLTVASALINGLSHDGVTYSTGDRILLKDQTAGAQNGIYVIVASGAASRSTDADATAEVGAGTTVFVDTGTVNGDTQYSQTATIATIGTTAQTWVKTFQSADLTGAGVTKKYTTLFGNGALTSFTITHSLGLAVPQACVAEIYLASTGAKEECEVTIVDGNSLTLSGWVTAPTASAYRVVVIG